MIAARRPQADRVEVGAPAVAALAARALGRMPAPIRRRALLAAFDRARDAFNRGDLEAVAAPGRFVRRASLVHRPGDGGDVLACSIVQTTELAAGRVVRQVNALEP